MTTKTQDKQIGEKIPHDYKLNGVGGNVCQRCGHFESSPDWPYYCYIKKPQPTSLEGVKRELNKLNYIRKVYYDSGHGEIDLGRSYVAKEDVWQFISQQISIAEERGEKREKKRAIKAINKICFPRDSTATNAESRETIPYEAGFERMRYLVICNLESLTHKSTKGK